MLYNGKFLQNLSVTIESQNHETCLMLTKYIKNQCDAWAFCVRYEENKSARKGPVLSREIMIRQVSYGSDILIFKEAIRRICSYLEIYHSAAKFNDQGSFPVDDKFILK